MNVVEELLNYPGVGVGGRVGISNGYGLGSKVFYVLGKALKGYNISLYTDGSCFFSPKDIQ